MVITIVTESEMYRPTNFCLLTLIVFLLPHGLCESALAQHEIPDTTAGKCLTKLLDAINGDDEEARNTFLHDGFAKNDAETLKKRMLQTKMVRSQLGKLSVKKIVKSSAEKITALCTSDSAPNILLSIQLSEESPKKIGSISLEMGEAEDSLVAEPLDDNAKSTVIKSLARELRAKYVFPDVGEEMAKTIEKSLSDEKYAKYVDAVEFASDLTDELRKICKDKHLLVRAGIPRRINSRPGRRPADNHGFVKAEILPGGIGYLKFNFFSGDPDAKKTASAAMNFLSNSETLIFDLRENGGGDPVMIAYLTSYLFDEPTHLNSFYNRPTDTTTESWTLKDVPGKKFSPETQVYVLTSNYTFSGAEEFSYNLQNLKRGTIVGETTGGGAHPIMPVTLAGRMNVSMPFARAINPITNTNWEGVGVKPHVEVASDQALEKAIELSKKKKAELASQVAQSKKETKTSNVDIASLARKASALMANESFVEAAKAFEKVTELDPDRGDAWFGYGYCLHMSGQLDEAIVAHKKAAKYPEFEGIATYNLACALSMQNKLNQSLDALEKAISSGFGDLNQIQGDSDLGNVRENERYKKLIEQLKDK